MNQIPGVEWFQLSLHLIHAKMSIPLYFCRMQVLQIKTIMNDDSLLFQFGVQSFKQPFLKPKTRPQQPLIQHLCVKLHKADAEQKLMNLF